MPPGGVMKCPACNAQNWPGAAHCKKCSTELGPNCAGCGVPIDGDHELCGACRTERVPAALGADLTDPDHQLAIADPTSVGEGGHDSIDPKLVGRVAPLERMRQLVERSVTNRQLHFAVLTGPPGSGKTRLVREVARLAAAEPFKARVLQATSGTTGAPPFAAFARLLAARFNITEGETGASARAKIVQGVEEVLPPARSTEVSHLLAHLCGCSFPESPIVEPLTDTPPQLEARMFIAARRFIAADADKTPLCLILDNVDCASPETVNLTHYLAAGLEGHPVVLLAVARSNLFEVHPTFGEGDATLERFELGPLSPQESEQLLVELTWPAGPPPLSLLRHVRDKLGGSPRALLELSRWLHETGALATKTTTAHASRRAASSSTGAMGPAGNPLRAGAWRWDETLLNRSPLPSTFEELLAARLAAMDGSERDLLEKAAACGESFWLDALVALVRAAAVNTDGDGDPDGPSLGEIAAAGDATRTEIAGALALLEQRGLVAASAHSAIPGEREFRFAYPPWWDVVYDRISAESRRRYHRLIAQWLELRPSGRGEEEQEEVARHLERAGDGVGAALRYRRAAEIARQRYFNDKAIRLYAQALQCSQGDVATRIHLWHDLGSIYQMKGDHESAIAAFERMLRLTWVVASRTKGAVALNKLGRVHRQKGDLDVALNFLERGLELFQQSGDRRGIAGSFDDIGQVLWLLGRYEEALDRSAAGLEERRRIGDKRSIAVSLLNIANIERHRGLFEEAASCYREALELRRNLNDRGGIANTLNGMGMLAFQRGDLDGARREWEEALHIADEIGALPLQAALESHLGEVARAVGNHGEARTRFEHAEQVARDLNDRRLLSEATRNLGLVELSTGANEKAIAQCKKALELAQADAIPVNVGRALLALGECHAATLFHDDSSQGPPAPIIKIGENFTPLTPADEFFQRGVDVFRKIGNDAELGIVLERFGKYRVERGDVTSGRKLLTEAHAIFARLGVKAGDALQRMILELG